MTKKEVRQTSSLSQTLNLGRDLARVLVPGDVLLLRGDLGAGKTALTRGIAQGLGVESHVSSPTFTILHIHETGVGDGISLCHFDAYRLQDSMDFYLNGFDEFIGDQNIAVIEWGERVREALPDRLIDIEIRYGPGEDDRVFAIQFPDDRTLGEGEKA